MQQILSLWSYQKVQRKGSSGFTDSLTTGEIFTSNGFHPWFALSGLLGPLVQLHPSKKPPVKTYTKLHLRDLMDSWQEVSNLALDAGTLYIFRFSTMILCLCSWPVRWLSVF